ncbi:MAG: sporulation initiation factor Spo0A C-terminal domain-containing protein [Clostridia bacterium]|nr:sporulation initiation factor Spo0A C-terminal domain-containing protein [Clostridia bacterium]
MREGLILEHRGLFIGRPDGCIAEVVKKIEELFEMSFLFTRGEEGLAERLYTFEPMLILAEVDIEFAGTLMSISQNDRFRRSMTIGLAKSNDETLASLIQNGVLNDHILISEDPSRDAADVFKKYKTSIKYGVNLMGMKQFAPIVTDLIWSDSTHDELRLRRSIADKLEKLGVSRRLLGHKYLIAAIAVQSSVCSAPEPKKLYRSIAEYYGTTPRAVEKAIRTAIESAWTTGDIEYQHSVFGMSVDEARGKPTNAEFIARLAMEY